MEDIGTKNVFKVLETFKKIINGIFNLNFLSKTKIECLELLRNYISDGNLLQEIKLSFREINLCKNQNNIYISPQDLINILTIVLVDNKLLAKYQEIKYFDVFDVEFMQQSITQQNFSELLININTASSYILENINLIIIKYNKIFTFSRNNISPKIEGVLIENNNEKITFEGSQVKLDSSKETNNQRSDLTGKYPKVDFADSNFEEMMEIQLLGIENSKKEGHSKKTTEIKKHPAFYLQKNSPFNEKGSSPSYFNNPNPIKNNIETDLRPIPPSPHKQQYIFNEQMNSYNTKNNQYFVNQMIDTRRCRQGRKTQISQDRPFVCEIHLCNSAFKRYEHLKRHKKIHTGEKPFQCPFMGCDRRFARSDNMTQHMKLHNSTKARIQNTNKTNYDGKESPNSGFHNMYDRI